MLLLESYIGGGRLEQKLSIRRSKINRYQALTMKTKRVFINPLSVLETGYGNLRLGSRVFTFVPLDSLSIQLQPVYHMYHIPHMTSSSKSLDF